MRISTRASLFIRLTANLFQRCVSYHNYKTESTFMYQLRLDQSSEFLVGLLYPPYIVSKFLLVLLVHLACIKITHFMQITFFVYVLARLLHIDSWLFPSYFIAFDILESVKCTGSVPGLSCLSECNRQTEDDVHSPHGQRVSYCRYCSAIILNGIQQNC